MSDAMSSVLGIPPLWARLLAAYDVHTEQDYLDLVDPGALSDPARLPDLPEAASIVAAAAAGGQHIRVHGDYDADGVTATALLVRALRLLGADVDAWIPNRFDEGYGLHPDAIARAREDRVDLMITVDCGSSSSGAADAARAAGIGLVITDHHRLPTILPVADAFVNPERLAVDRPILSGAGVALQLARTILGDEPPPACWGLAALGTVADVMPMRGDSRVIVQAGLKALSAGFPIGVRALQKAARRDADHITARDLGFSIAPRINAAGRLGSPQPALDLALADSTEEADRLAAKLEELNRRRRDLADLVLREAQAQLAARDGPLPPFVVVAGEGWNEGVVGIAAGRLSDGCERPVAVIAVGAEGMKGSARGGRYGDILQAFEPHRDRFLALGGHRGAAGFTLRPDRLQGLEAALSESFVPLTSPEARGPVLDASPGEMTDALGEFLLGLEPFGPGFEPPRFRLAGEIDAIRKMGREGRHARFRLRGAALESVGFGVGPLMDEVSGRNVEALWTLEPNWWQGRQRFELHLEELLWPPTGSRALGRQRWELGAPARTGRRLLVVAASKRRARQALPENAARVLLWWHDSRDRAARRLGVDRAALAGAELVYVVDGPPHRWALQALLAGLPDSAVVHWAPEALDPAPVLRRWARLVPDPDQLRGLWRARRDGRSPLRSGRRVLEDLGLQGGERPERRRQLQESEHFRTAWFERRAAERDWALGSPWAWREEDEARGLAE